MWLEGVLQLKTPVTSSGIELETFDFLKCSVSLSSWVPIAIVEMQFGFLMSAKRNATENFQNIVEI
jgi:hypothetical protein